jgi:hypothetical protein
MKQFCQEEKGRASHHGIKIVSYGPRPVRGEANWFGRQTGYEETKVKAHALSSFTTDASQLSAHLRRAPFTHSLALAADSPYDGHHAAAASGTVGACICRMDGHWNLLLHPRRLGEVERFP